MTGHSAIRLWAGVHDALSAHLASLAGFDGLWLSSYGLSAALLAKPDAGFLLPDDAKAVCQRIRDITDLPLTVDIENGYELSDQAIARVAAEIVEAGATAVCIEDTCGQKFSSLWHGVTRSLRDRDEMCVRIRAIRAQCHPLGAEVVARTESLILGDGVDEAATRVRAYRTAGADAVVPHFRERFEDVLQVARQCVGVPLVVIPTMAPDVSFDELDLAGFDVAVVANASIRAAVRAMSETLGSVVRERTVAAGLRVAASLEEMDTILDRVATVAAVESRAHAG